MMALQSAAAAAAAYKTVSAFSHRDDLIICSIHGEA